MKRKMIVGFILMILFIITFTITCNASTSVDPIDNPSYYLPTDGGEDSPKLKSIAGVILGTIEIVGTIISVITLMVIGIKYMCGSVEEKADYKQTMWPWLLGAALLFGATTIPNILFNLNIFG